MHIRPATPDDLGDLVALGQTIGDFYASQYAGLFKPPSVDRSETLYRSMFENDEFQISVACGDDGSVQGVVILQIFRRPEDPYTFPKDICHVHELVVHAKHRRKGIGRELMSAVCQAADERNCDAVELAVWDAAPSALAFYEAVGFTTQHRRMIRTP